MITGRVQDSEARITLKLRGPGGDERAVEAVIDTGFTGSLTLPSTLIQELGLEWQSLGRGLLADGSECLYDVFMAEAEWDGRWVYILVDEAESAALVGMSLLDGYELRIEVSNGGAVMIQSLP